RNVLTEQAQDRLTSGANYGDGNYRNKTLATSNRENFEWSRLEDVQVGQQPRRRLEWSRIRASLPQHIPFCFKFAYVF
ncbi:MAG TPA: hypothetical protein VIH54_12670, partial [Chthoniobacterales bacterium]